MVMRFCTASPITFVISPALGPPTTLPPTSVPESRGGSRDACGSEAGCPEGCRIDGDRPSERFHHAQLVKVRRGNPCLSACGGCEHHGARTTGDEVTLLGAVADCEDARVARAHVLVNHHEPVFVQRQSRRRRKAGMQIGTGLRDQALQPFIISLEPGTSADGPVTHPGQELVHCLSGTVEYTVSGTVYRLEPGDSLLLAATEPHSFSVGTDEPVTMLVVFQANDSLDLGRQRHLDPGSAL